MSGVFQAPPPHYRPAPPHYLPTPPSPGPPHLAFHHYPAPPPRLPYRITAPPPPRPRKMDPSQAQFAQSFPPTPPSPRTPHTSASSFPPSATSSNTRLPGQYNSSPSAPTSGVPPFDPALGQYNHPEGDEKKPEGRMGVTVFECSGYEGTQGELFTIRCDVNFGHYDGAYIGRAIRLVFGTYPVPTTVALLPDARESAGQYCSLSATVPPQEITGGVSRGNKCPVFVQIIAGEHVLVGESVGEFAYSPLATPRVPYSTYSPHPSQMPGPPKRENSGSDELYSVPPGAYGRQRLPSNASHHSGHSGQYQAQGAQPTGFSPYGSPWAANAEAPAVVDGQPNLQRASQIPPPMPMPYHPASNGKASLELAADVTEMARGWTPEEWQVRRRLVQFWRRQHGTKIVACFSAVPAVEYTGNTAAIIVSCIYREDDNQCYITSVDAIYLLEALVGSRFTVEEKNRIRRNLEGFRPMTVSKSKAGSEDFFKLIMGFSNPKPRNIEKDVKVFHWDILGSALKKIIGKYSANYSSPSPAMQSGPLPMYHAPQPPVHQAPAQYHQPYPQDHGGPSSTYQPPRAQTGGYDASASVDPPALTSHNSGDSSSSFAHYPQPHTPPHDGYAAPGGSEKKPNLYNISPTNNTAPYNENSGVFWSGQETIIPQGGSSYMAGAYPDQAAQLPHVHQTEGRTSSSHDLRVVYPNHQDIAPQQ